jgi:hypothetical protein
MKQYYIYVLTCFLLFSCSKNGNGELEQKIEARITATCKGEDCSIDLSKVTSFKWSKFFVFKETSSLETVERAINQSYPYFTDVGRRLIFLDESNKIVYHEDIFPNVEGVKNKEVVFYIPDTIDFKVYTNPNFIVTKEELEKGHYFILSQ